MSLKSDLFSAHRMKKHDISDYLLVFHRGFRINAGPCIGPGLPWAQ